MKKLIYTALALGSVFGLASCSSDGPDAPVQGDGATFTIRLPKDMQTRATFGDQSKVQLNNLQWTIYDCTSGTPTLVQSGSKANAFAASQTEEQVTLPLVKGHKYQVTFYADNAENAYASYSDGKVNVDYSLGKSNDKEEDCFVGKSNQILVTGGFNETVTLTRPYSQLNWGTNDLNEATVQAVLQGLLANVKVSGLYKTMDVLTGEFSDPVGEAVTFPNVDMQSLPAETFPVEGYTLIAMNYLLCGNGTVDCSLNFNNNVQSVVVNQAPVKVNYRTNIYGALLTAPGQFNIIVDPNWNEPDINIPEVTNSADFLSALANPAVSSVVVSNDLDLTGATVDQLTFNTPKTITVASGKTIKLGADNYLHAKNGITLRGTGTITNVGSAGHGQGFQKALVVCEGGNVDIDGTTLINDPDYHWHGSYYENAAVSYENVGTVTINNANITSGGFCLRGYGPDKATTKLVITNSKFESTSSSALCSNWAYAFKICGSEATFDNCEVKGVQGCLSTNNAIKVTVNSGKYYTENTTGHVDAFYPVYSTSGATFIINGGEFSSPNDRSDGLAIGGTSCLVSGDNDTGATVGSFVLQGGKLSGKAYNHVSKTIYEPASGYSYTALTGQDPYKWQVTKN